MLAISNKDLKKDIVLWLVWLSWLGVIVETEKSLADSPSGHMSGLQVLAIPGRVCSLAWGACSRQSIDQCFSLTSMILSLFLPPFPFLWNQQKKKKKGIVYTKIFQYTF